MQKEEELNWRCNTKVNRSIVENISIEAFIDDDNKELTIEFSQDTEPVIIEIKSKEGHIVYRNFFIPYSDAILSISLENIPAGVYELAISDEEMESIGVFAYQP